MVDKLFRAQKKTKKRIFVKCAHAHNARAKKWKKASLTMDQSSSFEVLLELEGSRRPVSVSGDLTAASLTIAIERELGKLGRDIVLSPFGTAASEAGERRGTKPVYVLQRFSEKWGFIDVVHILGLATCSLHLTEVLENQW